MIIKKIILNILLVAIVVFIMDLAIGKTLHYFYFSEIAGLHFRTTYSMETTEADVLIFGSSRANHHYVPEVFEEVLNKTFYNTGRDGNGIFFQTALLKSVLNRHTPKTIILDYAGGFGKEEDAYSRMSSLLPYYKTHDEIKEDIERKSLYENIKLLSSIYPFNSQAFTIAIGNLEINKKRKSNNKGYVALYKKWDGEIRSIDTITSHSIDSNKISSFREFLLTAKESNTNIIVVYSPFYRDCKWNQGITICSKLCSDEGITFYDYSKDTLFLNNSKLFKDAAHLNHDGALIFSKLLSNKIKKETRKNLSPKKVY